MHGHTTTIPCTRFSGCRRAHGIFWSTLVQTTLLGNTILRSTSTMKQLTTMAVGAVIQMITRYKPLTYTEKPNLATKTVQEQRELTTAKQI